MSTYTFVLCPSFHGATLLSCLLNNHSKVSSLGDTVPRVEFIENDIECSCGSTITSCDFWQEVFEKLNPDKTYRDDCLIPFYPVLLKNERYNEILVKMIDRFTWMTGISLWPMFRRQCEKYVDYYREFGKLTRDLQNTEYFISGQKNIILISILKSLADTNGDIKVIHLIRDPRAAYYSNIKRYNDYPLDKFCRNWVAYHERARKTGTTIGNSSYFQILYEEMCASPDRVMEELQHFLGLEPENLLIPSTNFRIKHVIGNTMLKKFDGNIRLDRKWETALSAAEQDKILNLTQPLSGNLGYMVEGKS